MNMPNFTAEASLYKTPARYRLSAGIGGSSASQPGLVRLMQLQSPGPDAVFPSPSRCFGCFPNPNSVTGCSRLCINFFPLISLRNCQGCDTLTCGGILGESCPGANQYCDFGIGNCSVADAQGTCKPRAHYLPIDICASLRLRRQNIQGTHAKRQPRASPLDHQGKCGGDGVLQ